MAEAFGGDFGRHAVASIRVAAPALVAGGLLASLGAVVRSPVVLALGLAVVGP